MGVATIDLGTDDVRFEVDDHGVAVVTLHRPETRNAFSAAMGRALSDAHRIADADDAIAVLVLTGTAPAFCAGADLSSGADVFDAPDTPAFRACPVEPTAWQIRTPVIAAVNGHAVGIGFTLALHADLRVMATEGRYGVVQVRRGVLPDAYSHWTLPRIAGLANAADLLLTGRTFNGDEALALGVANKVVPADEVLPTAVAMARDIAASSAPLSVALSKRLLWEGLTMGPEEVGRLETEMHHHVMGSPDAREGVEAFLARRPPQWTSSPTTDWPDDVFGS